MTTDAVLGRFADCRSPLDVDDLGHHVEVAGVAAVALAQAQRMIRTDWRK